MLLSLSNLNHTIYSDLLLVIEAQRYERISFSLPVAQPRIVRKGPVNDVVLKPTSVSSVYFNSLKYKAPVKFLAGLFRGRGHSAKSCYSVC